MPLIDRTTSAVLVVDFQARLMPAIHEGDLAVAQARRLLDAAALLGVPVAYTEQNPAGLGATVDALAPREGVPVLSKMTFDATRAPGFAGILPDRPDILVAGCEAHVCVLQTAFGLLAMGRRVHIVCDAVGSRRAESRDVALRRLEQAGASLVTTEMAVFEWVGTAADPRFREAVKIIK